MNSSQKRSILLRSSWQTINIGDIAHTPGVLTLLEKYLPGVEVRLWASDVGRGVRDMLQRRFPNVEIFQHSDRDRIQAAFDECDFMLHGSGPYVVAANHLDRWKQETGKPYGIYGVSLPWRSTDESILNTLNHSEFVFFRDTVSMEFARLRGAEAPVMEFGPDGAFAVDLRNDEAAETFLAENGLEEGQFLCVIPRYRWVPEWTIPSKNKEKIDRLDQVNQRLKEHDHKPYRDAIAAVVRQSSMKVLICPEDMTQIQLGKEMLYDPLPDDVKERVVWRDHFWITDEALSTFVRSAGVFGLEQHSPIMCIGNGIPAFVGRFLQQGTKGYMWNDIGLAQWMFDSDSQFDMQRLIPNVLALANQPGQTKAKAMQAKQYVEKYQEMTMQVLRETLA